ncbi:MAG: HD domain-containing protein [Cytophagaceae bacterium]|nr:HD domain-containing protein [Cytophagaceae bacterium]
MLHKAIEIATEAHKNQKDKYGAPYILHLMRVSLRGKSMDEKICGMLHDLVEDTSWTFEALQKEGFSDEIIAALKCVTKISENEDYNLFIERVKTNPLAIKVKINDLEDNMDIRRINKLEEKDLARLNKYLLAYHDLVNYKQE